MSPNTDRVLRELVEGPPADSLAAARERFVGLAEEAGLIDVAYATEDSPFGPILLAATELGLVMVSLPGLRARLRPRAAGFARSRPGSSRLRRASTRPAASSTSTSPGRLREFDLPLDWQLTTGFRRRVLRATARIPYGETRSYTEMARSAGNERAQRAAGSALGSNPIPIVVPCHRVLRTGGALGGYGGGLAMKQALLELEGAR